MRDRLAITSLPVRADGVILIETEDGVQRMAVREMFDDFEALKVCLGNNCAASDGRNRDGADGTRRNVLVHPDGINRIDRPPTWVCVG